MMMKTLLTLAALVALSGCTGTLSSEALDPETGEPTTPGEPSEPGEPGEPAGPQPQTSFNPWQSGGDVATCEVDDIIPPHVYIRRAKNMLTGLAPTQDELTRLEADPEAVMPELVAEWSETPEFDAKMAEFFTHALQQIPETDRHLGAQLRDNSGGQANLPDALERNLEEAFVRTAVELVRQGKPFNEIARTRSWQMTTAMMSFLAATDTHPDDAAGMIPTFYKTPITHNGIDFDADTPAATQIANLTFYAPRLGEPKNQGGNALPCSDHPYSFHHMNRGRTDLKKQWFDLIVAAMGSTTPNICPLGVEIFRESDFSDWREVTMVDSDSPDPSLAYDPIRLRSRNTLPLRVKRNGFYTSPAFLASWETNEDNSFRVTTQQTLIVGTGLAFEDQDVTTPLGDEGLAEAHAAPNTQCYACHKNLDPLRNFFARDFTYPFYRPVQANNYAPMEASFSFQGHTGSGESLLDLGKHIAEHPYFARGWTQKMCFYVNSAECDTSDPEFTRIAQAFEDSNFDFKTLIVELMSSPLTTGARCEGTFERELAPPSVARRRHLCATLVNRTGANNVCTNTNTSRLLTTLPQDSWSRGNTVPNQPAAPSLFYAATLDAFCQRVATLVVNVNGSQLQSSQMESSLEFLVTDIMGLPTGDPRHAPVLATLQQVVTDADGTGANERDQLRTAFTVTCNSPFVASMDF